MKTLPTNQGIEDSIESSNSLESNHRSIYRNRQGFERNNGNPIFRNKLNGSNHLMIKQDISTESISADTSKQ